MTNDHIGMHGDVVVFLKHAWGYQEGDRVIVDEEEETRNLRIFDCVTGHPHPLVFNDEGIIWKREYTEGRAKMIGI